MTFRVGFVTGSTPDKWARAWRDRERERLELVPLEEDAQEQAVRSGAVHMALVRLPVEREGLHLVPLYEELPVAVMSVEDPVSLLDEVTTEDLADAQLVAPERSGWRPSVDQLDWPAMTTAEAVETVAAGTGIVVVPMAIARLHPRRDVTTRTVTDLPSSQVGLAWLVEGDDPRMQTFVGIVRGRTARSSR